MNNLVHKYLDAFHIHVQKDHENEILPILANHLEAVIYNITGIAMAIALVNNSYTIDCEHLASVRNYIQTSCKKTKKGGSQKGGTSMPSDYFGYKHPNFLEWNAGDETNVSEVQFDTGIARSEMGGGAATLLPFMAKEKLAKTAIKDFLKKHEVKIREAALKELLIIIDAHLNCLAKDLYSKEPTYELKKTKLEKVMKLKRHAVFH